MTIENYGAAHKESAAEEAMSVIISKNDKRNKHNYVEGNGV